MEPPVRLDLDQSTDLHGVSGVQWFFIKILSIINNLCRAFKLLGL